MTHIRFRSPFHSSDADWTVVTFSGPEEEEMSELLIARLLARDYDIEIEGVDDDAAEV